AAIEDEDRRIDRDRGHAGLHILRLAVGGDGALVVARELAGADLGRVRIGADRSREERGGHGDAERRAEGDGTNAVHGFSLAAALRTEGADLRRLQGPRFVKILEEHLEDDPPYFVLELCEKGDLRAALDRAEGRRLSPEVVLRLAEGILEGCAFAHDEGVVHG